MKIGISCAFKNDFEGDGLIPASTIIEEGPREGGVLPIIGYLAYSLNGVVRWNFVKYEAPETYAPWEKRPSIRGQFATTRVANIYCAGCGYSGPIPVRGNGRNVRCPYCGGYTEFSIIKENSSEFCQLVGELRDPLEKAAKAAEKSDTEFEYPLCLVSATSIGVSHVVPPVIARSFQMRGHGVKLIQEMSGFQGMLDLQDYSPALSIVPGVVSGYLDYEEAKMGWSKGWPVFSWWVRLYLPELRHRRYMPFSARR